MFGSATIWGTARGNANRGMSNDALRAPGFREPSKFFGLFPGGDAPAERGNSKKDTPDERGLLPGCRSHQNLPMMGDGTERPLVSDSRQAGGGIYQQHTECAHQDDGWKTSSPAPTLLGVRGANSAAASIR
ncbi:protein of unknown function [Hyphomicrobium sp. MC1]|nr:protein of unknown function [Hyphomicrobium sp. MC1]